MVRLRNFAAEYVKKDYHKPVADVLPKPQWPKESSPRRLCYSVLTNSEASKVGMFVNVVIMICILVSVTSFVVETLPEFRFPKYGENPGDSLPVFDYIDFVSVVIFTIEYGMKLLCCTSQTVEELGGPSRLFFVSARPEAFHLVWLFVFNLMNFIDFVAIAPFWISLLAGQDAQGFAVARVLRVARVFRIFKLGKYSDGMAIFIQVLYISFPALMQILFFMILWANVCGVLIFLLEKGHYVEEEGAYMREDKFGYGDLEKTPFLSHPAALYWYFTTSTTIGYGDLYPTSTWGRLIGVLTQLSGIAIMALPVATIGINFYNYIGLIDRFSYISGRNGEEEVDILASQIQHISLMETQIRDILEQLAMLRQDLERTMQIYGDEDEIVAPLLTIDLADVNADCFIPDYKRVNSRLFNPDELNRSTPGHSGDERGTESCVGGSTPHSRDIGEEDDPRCEPGGITNTLGIELVNFPQREESAHGSQSAGSVGLVLDDTVLHKNTLEVPQPQERQGEVSPSPSRQRIAIPYVPMMLEGGSETDSEGSPNPESTTSIDDGVSMMVGDWHNLNTRTVWRLKQRIHEPQDQEEDDGNQELIIQRIRFNKPVEEVDIQESSPGSCIGILKKQYDVAFEFDPEKPDVMWKMVKNINSDQWRADRLVKLPENVEKRLHIG